MMNSWLLVVRKASPFGPQRSKEVGNPSTPVRLSEPSKIKVFISKALRVTVPFADVKKYARPAVVSGTKAD